MPIREGRQQWRRVMAAAVLGWMICRVSVLPAAAAGPDTIRFAPGAGDAVIIAAPGGYRVITANPETPLIPASTLKLLTALVALDTLGEDYRFPTAFYRSDDNDLVVKGYGDPLFVSEAIDTAAAQLADRLTGGHPGDINDLLLDRTYFAASLTVPGVSDTANPYDAPNGALCANFNTVFYKRTAGGIVSAEPQTPLLPFALERIPKDGRKSGDRIVLSHAGDDATLYAGYLLGYFLARKGIRILGHTRVAPVDPSRHRLLMRVESPDRLRDAVARMMSYSNNFIANQLLIAAGTARFGSPGTLDKGVRLALDFAHGPLGLSPTLRLAEGSGISRKNRISAADLLRVLESFEPYAELLTHTGDDYFKTGTLNGIRTRAGYLTGDSGAYRYVVMLNSGRHRMADVMPMVRELVANHRAKNR